MSFYYNYLFCYIPENGNPDNISSLYLATVTDFAKDDPLIYRPELKNGNIVLHDFLRTLPQDKKTLIGETPFYCTVTSRNNATPIYIYL